MIETFLKSFANLKKNKIAIAGAHDESVLGAVKQALDFSIAEFFLVGDKAKIETIAKEVSLDLKKVELVEETDDIMCAKKAVALVKDGYASALMKGKVETSTILKAVLDKENGLRGTRKLSHIAMFFAENYHKPLFVTDAAININPTFDEKRDIIENAVVAVRALGIKTPKVALICAKEHVDEKMPVTLEYARLVEMNKADEITNCVVDGPFALDNAVSKEAAKTKGIESEVAGDADIIFCPEIVSANVLYKSLTMFAKASVGGAIIGANAPVILTSRADSKENKLLSIALGAIIGGGATK
ncbi:MAG: bifunctional enoyl-CoA hydratase/phosphate acetyltransferase [Firmicutes bacterium]|nr:bifunctional enoyl-CoA hydratase/phosphate acetyltransferase [Bacillota bacterium]MCL2256402.1 bifunctional enoyl-CoA hydratase/phosphate acetyltransferase [Bacillota bacterium]